MTERKISEAIEFPQKYLKAKELVCGCIPYELIAALKEVRLRGVKISKINADDLGTLLPNASRSTVDGLCEKFPVWI